VLENKGGEILEVQGRGDTGSTREGRYWKYKGGEIL
jgi:hypothetical protein